ncbi:hypothetical protein M7I_1675 [Glarea lozoyensis 74030]|uniref:Uncharacterized protein n=1 Tax=Glarea lozoyensis (strain ATCC 74030 / MF5533) TaxID=1104152 RepID=H0EGQ6_GLAL7|nr:hypothetical protein M7I_1675 [Glarea lozoyensis 74030]
MPNFSKQLSGISTSKPSVLIKLSTALDRHGIAIKNSAKTIASSRKSTHDSLIPNKLSLLLLFRLHIN